jgi:hypothetical protein
MKRHRQEARSRSPSNPNSSPETSSRWSSLKRGPLARYVLAVVSSLVFLGMVGRTSNRYLTTPGLSIRQYDFVSRNFAERKTALPDYPYNDLTNGGIQAKVTLSTNMFQIALLMSAGLAGLLIARDKEAGFLLGEGPERIMFAGASLLLLISFVSHALYLTEVSYIYFLAGKLFRPNRPSMPDISDSNVNFLLEYQIIYLVVGTVLASFTFFSAHVLKRRKRE